jgi:hypothetical protein
VCVTSELLFSDMYLYTALWSFLPLVFLTEHASPLHRYAGAEQPPA